MAFAASPIGSLYINRCTVPVQGTGSPTVMTNNLAQSTIGDITIPYEDKVPCPECCRTHVAPVLSGSPVVFVNGLATTAIVDVALGTSGLIKLCSGTPTVLIA